MYMYFQIGMEKGVFITVFADNLSSMQNETRTYGLPNDGNNKDRNFDREQVLLPPTLRLIL